MNSLRSVSLIVCGILYLFSSTASAAGAPWSKIKVDVRRDIEEDKKLKVTDIKPEGRGRLYNLVRGRATVPGFEQMVKIVFTDLYGAKFQQFATAYYEKVDGSWVFQKLALHVRKELSPPSKLPKPSPLPDKEKLKKLINNGLHQRAEVEEVVFGTATPKLEWKPSDERGDRLPIYSVPLARLTLKYKSALNNSGTEFQVKQIRCDDFVLRLTRAKPWIGDPPERWYWESKVFAKSGAEWDSPHTTGEKECTAVNKGK